MVGRQFFSKMLVSLAFIISLSGYTNIAKAATGGGATIHNAATLTFNGGIVTASVDVLVNTIASAPTIAVDRTAVDVFAGSVSRFTYTITNNSNGSDDFSLNASSLDANVDAAAGLVISDSSVTLGGSVTSRPSAANTVFIPAGSEQDFDVGDTVVINGNTFRIDAVTPGTIARTVGNNTTPETPSELTLSPLNGAPPIGASDIPAGTQIGEQATFTVDVTAANPTVVGVNGTHTVDVSGTTTAVTAGAGGAPVNFSTSAANGNQVIVTILAAQVTLSKEVRNVTQSGSFALSNVTAQPGDILEYRLTATATSGNGDATGNVLTDEVPEFTTYISGSTTLNGSSIADGSGASLPLSSANGGLTINSPSGAAGVIAEGESAVVLFRVTVD